jgi:2-polyprenyl-3-methyl-5-hydroxy-6-metoxy-1,4-benzoquinol methylase
MDGRKYLKTAMYTSIRARPASLFKLLRKTKGKHVLDYGSGVGTHAIICLESGCDGVDLLDVAGPLRKFARWRIDLRSYKNAKYLEHNTTLIKSTYDCVICIDALEHIPDPAVALENMLNALRVGGVFYVLVGKPKIAAGHLTEIWAEWSSLGQKVLQKYCKKISENLYRRI